MNKILMLAALMMTFGGVAEAKRRPGSPPSANNGTKSRVKSGKSTAHKSPSKPKSKRR